ncbi:hypothetical protein NLX86_22515 [Streptomyces sp. A3M-1-3]|uniref:hypothetical protein n=1 Tax=Streptomyces sp. A3M-1-3 TaxID=2962044 RepID=UPI0020B64945|nr:hypothetical protein [Streptomyces sp. A3M-1-3]MCP3820766.1 hypothetical protein [Streptomyces sp. A3M-1-3]
MSGPDPDLAATNEALGLIAQGLTAALAELKELGMVGQAGMGRGFSDIALTGLETGSAGLTAKFGTFCERWEWGVRSLVQEGNNFAQQVGLSAGVFHEQEQYLQGAFKVAVNAGIGNPHATEDEITKKSWGDVFGDNMYTDDFDYSQESAQEALGNAAQGWKDAGRDVATSEVGMLGVVQQGIDAAGQRDEFDAQLDETFGPSPDERAKAAEHQQNGDGGEG